MKRLPFKPILFGTTAVASTLFLVQCGVGGVNLNMAAILFSNQIYPIFDQYCVTCHKPNGIAPFALTTHNEIYGRRGQIASAVGARVMPPWGAEDAVGCPRIQNSHWLPQSKIDLLQFWISAGAPAGPAIAPLQGQSTGFEINNPDLYARAPQPHTPTFPGGHDTYPCLLAKTNQPVAAGGAYINEIAFKPTNDRITHHAIVKRLITTADPGGQVAADFDAKYAQGQAVNCWEILDIANPLKWETVTLWSAGGKKLNFESSTAKIFMPAGDNRFVFEMHYSAANGGTGSDQSEVQFKFAPPAPTGTSYGQVLIGGTVGAFPSVGNPPLPGLPANTPNIVIPTAGYVSFLPFNSYRMILGILPHMHQFGRSFSTQIVRANGTRECLVSVPKYDFNWQWTYMFESPVILGPGDTLDSIWGMDTSGHNSIVYPGEQTTDEMMFGFTYEALMPVN